MKVSEESFPEGKSYKEETKGETRGEYEGSGRSDTLLYHSVIHKAFSLRKMQVRIAKKVKYF